MRTITSICTAEQGANPVHMHDCECCTFLGNGEIDNTLVDLFAHQRENKVEFIIRFSDEPSDYGCWSICDNETEQFMPYEYKQVRELFKNTTQKPVNDDRYRNEEHKSGPTFKQFVMAGKAIFTVHNDKGEHYTYRIVKKEEKGTFGTKFFAQLLTGPNNTRNYQYIGVLETNSGTVRTSKASTLSPNSKPMKVINWALGKIVWRNRFDKLPEGYGIIHEGRCGRCSRVLTTPESIQIGIGPECLGKLGI